ncbi:unannotated protein [freshwater metagenome]|uniref:Unannotated protein n=1 Tax=freshwater metagenome TaxID=449393 RepID=A0A6J7TAA3_9ZZZZ
MLIRNFDLFFCILGILHRAICVPYRAQYVEPGASSLLRLATSHHQRNSSWPFAQEILADSALMSPLMRAQMLRRQRCPAALSIQSAIHLKTAHVQPRLRDVEPSHATLRLLRSQLLIQIRWDWPFEALWMKRLYIENFLHLLLQFLYETNQ